MSQTNMAVVEGKITNVFDSKSGKVKVVQIQSDNTYEKDGETKGGKNYVKFTVFQSTENFNELKVGAEVKLTGTIGTNSWEKDGVKHYDLQIIANKIEINEKAEDIPEDIPKQEEINKAINDIPF